MTNPLTSREAPDPMTLTGFSPKAQQEMKNNEFAARTGGLVNCSASTYWELAYAARAWHEHAESMQPQNLRIAEEVIALETGGAAAVFALRKERRARLATQEAVSPLSAQPSDTTPSETSKES